ncbi:MAG: SEC-C domain-containing protein [Phycisphaeraceae bacterium]|nr:SEC-C domain-containing protein [Phycisphaeraceae bacterium]
MTAWFESDPARWAGEQEIAHRLMEGVTATIDESGRSVIRGTFRLLSEHGTELDRFALRFVYPDGFPSRGLHPSVYLDSHRDRWRNTVDSHIESDWKLCPYVPGESEVNCLRPDALATILARVHVFLRLETIYQRDLVKELTTGIKARWPGPQRSHGDLGLLEAARERRPSPNGPCICGSGKKYKKCHLWKLSRPKGRR